MFVRDFSGNEEMVLDFMQDSVEISRDLQGKYELHFTIVKTDRNKFAYDMIQDLVSIIVEDEVFTVRMIDENPYSKSVTCTHEFFEQIDVLADGIMFSGEYYFDEAVSFLNSYTSDWDFVSTGTSYKVFLENFGQDNIISLLNEITKEYEVEYTVSSKDKTVRVSPKIGSETDYQVRYGHNLVAISKSIDANNVKTHIKVRYNPDDEGNYQRVVTYVSPKASNYPKPKWAKTVEFDTDSATLASVYGASKIVDTPSISIEVEFIELQKNGYNGNEINIGNSFFLIDKRMNEEDLARIVEMTTYPYSKRSPVVTLANRVKYYTDLSIIQQQKQQLLDDEAVKKGENLDGVILTEKNGLEVRAENNRQVKIWINAREGFTIVNGTVRKFYIDTMGNVNFDGRLNITANNGATQMLEAYMDTRGGRLKIFDNIGFLNVSAGSENTGYGYAGGNVQVYSDTNQSTPLATMSANALNNFSDPVGRFFARNSSGNGTIEIQADKGITIKNGSQETFLDYDSGYIDGERIATEEWVQAFVLSVLP